jgi:hypothetical protein
LPAQIQHGYRTLLARDASAAELAVLTRAYERTRADFTVNPTATTGLATAWNPGADNNVRALAVSGSTVYAGGYFTSIGGQSRTYIAALDAGTGLATAWNPGAVTLGVDALAVDGSTVYAGGSFSEIGGQSRHYIAALDAATGLATAWNPAANGTVTALAVSGSTVYAGGGFGGGIAALDATTGLATVWNPGRTASYSPWRWAARRCMPAAATHIGGTTQSYLAAMEDSPTPTLLARFEAEATSAGVQLRWQFGEPSRVASATLERATNRVGPWLPLTLERHRTADATEALDATAAAGEIYYYRLTASLTDGTQAVFGPISAAALLGAKVSGLTGIAPNPVSGNASRLRACARGEDPDQRGGCRGARSRGARGRTDGCRELLGALGWA